MSENEKSWNADVLGFATISLLLLFFWFMLAPYLDFYNVFLGLVFSLGLTYTWRKIIFLQDKKTNFGLKQIYLFVHYFLHLIKNVIHANITVAKIVLSPKMPISPGIIVLRTILENNLSKVFYCNSITLTPGTVTVEIDRDKLIVHVLTRENAYDVSDWYMERLMRTIEKSEPVKPVKEGEREKE